MIVDVSSTDIAMQSLKKVMAVVSAVVATDYVGRVVMDMVPMEVKTKYMESVLHYIEEVYAL
ncbi:MAG: hypothetical protein WBJ81_00240 [Rickettsiales bacterium]